MTKFGDPNFNHLKVISQTGRFYGNLNVLTPNYIKCKGQISTIYSSIFDLPIMHLMTKFSDPSFDSSKFIA